MSITTRCRPPGGETQTERTSVIFGDGLHGARPPTGTANLKATYRYGIGAAANVDAAQISQLATHPLGAQGVVLNPLAATGGADADTLEQARANAPLAVMALDRLVSVRDYADFARTYAGIGKAVATRISDGRELLVHATIAGAGDIPIAPSSDLTPNLLLSLQTYGDPYQPVAVDVRSVRLIVMSATIGLSPDYVWENVAPKIRAALLARFAFDTRSLGQTAFQSEAVLAAQSVEGVAFVNVTVFDGVAEDITVAPAAALRLDVAGTPVRARAAGAHQPGGGAGAAGRIEPAEAGVHDAGHPRHADPHRGRLIRHPDRLYELVPVVYRLRDADRGYPLRALLRVVDEQLDVVERDIGGLYENWFIETCADWVVPYIGALVGYTPVSTGPATSTTRRTQARERITMPRREVANTIRFRRRKGTLSVLEDLAEAVAGWPARAVEFYRLLAVTQNIDYLRMDRGRLAELRNVDALDSLGGAFDELARNVDVRRTTSTRTQGTANIPEVGVFVWRLGAYSVTMAPAYPYDEESPSSYLFSALANDTQLFTDPNANADPTLPLPITRRAFEAREIHTSSTTPESGVPFDYGAGKSVMLWTGTPPAPVTADRIIAADLSDWTYRPAAGTVALDPVLGRIAFPPQTRRLPVWVSYSYGFSAELGGGEYDRTLAQPPNAIFYRVGSGAPFAALADALARWRTDAPADAVIEIVDSGVYDEAVAVELAAGQTLQLRRRTARGR